jgi:hypothetical protein
LADTVKLQVPLDPKLHKDFKLASVEDEFDMAQKVRDLITSFLEQRRKIKGGK